MLRKPNQLNYTTVKSYRVISLSNCRGKFCEKVMANMLAEWYRINYMFHEDQITSKRESTVIDPTASVFNRVQECWVEEKQAGILLIEVNGVFDHINRNSLLPTLECIRAGSN